MSDTALLYKRVIALVAVLVVVYWLAQRAFGNTVESFASTMKEMNDIHQVVTSLNEHEYALSHNMKELVSVLVRALSQWGYELISIGESLHYSLSDITIRNIATKRFYRFKSVTFLPNPLNGFEIRKIIFEVY